MSDSARKKVAVWLHMHLYLSLIPAMLIALALWIAHDSFVTLLICFLPVVVGVLLVAGCIGQRDWLLVVVGCVFAGSGLLLLLTFLPIVLGPPSPAFASTEQDPTSLTIGGTPYYAVYYRVTVSRPVPPSAKILRVNETVIVRPQTNVALSAWKRYTFSAEVVPSKSFGPVLREAILSLLSSTQQDLPPEKMPNCVGCSAEPTTIALLNWPRDSFYDSHVPTSPMPWTMFSHPNGEDIQWSVASPYDLSGGLEFSYFPDHTMLYAVLRPGLVSNLVVLLAGLVIAAVISAIVQAVFAKLSPGKEEKPAAATPPGGSHPPVSYG